MKRATREIRKPKQSRAIESREKVVEGARFLLSTEGYKKFGMRRIAKTSGVGLGTIYDYFPSKFAILDALLRERLKLRLEIFDRTVAKFERPAPVDIFVDNYLVFMREEGFWSIYDVELRQASQDFDKLKELLDWYEAETIERYIRALKAAGSPWSDADLNTVSTFLISVASQIEPGIIVEGGQDGRYLMNDLVRQTFFQTVNRVLQPS